MAGRGQKTVRNLYSSEQRQKGAIVSVALHLFLVCSVLKGTTRQGIHFLSKRKGPSAGDQRTLQIHAKRTCRKRESVAVTGVNWTLPYEYVIIGSARKGKETQKNMVRYYFLRGHHASHEQGEGVNGKSGDCLCICYHAMSQ